MCVCVCVCVCVHVCTYACARACVCVRTQGMHNVWNAAYFGRQAVEANIVDTINRMQAEKDAPLVLKLPDVTTAYLPCTFTDCLFFCLFVFVCAGGRCDGDGVTTRVTTRVDLAKLAAAQMPPLPIKKSAIPTTAVTVCSPWLI